MVNFSNFSLSELIRSDTADARGIDNTPNFIEVGHLHELASEFLQPLRNAWGKPIIISSGYRCKALNSVLPGASPTSVHMNGYAADMQVAGNMAEFDRFVEFTIDWVKKYHIKFDQLLIESKGNVKWLHVGLRSNSGSQRGEIKIKNL